VYIARAARFPISKTNDSMHTIALRMNAASSKLDLGGPLVPKSQIPSATDTSSDEIAVNNVRVGGASGAFTAVVSVLSKMGFVQQTIVS
jgi:hypothetical protein